MSDFTKFNLPEALLKSLESMGITAPTPIQEASISLSLEGKDILASAETGSGKTFAYALPLAAQLINNPSGGALILAPTRELAGQIKDAVLTLLGKSSAVKVALLIGGDSMGKQMSQLRARPRLIVGTPGRINDHLMRGTLSIKETSFLVIDEADRMLDMGFGVQLDRIAKYLPQKRQTLMFSATLTPNIVKLADKYLDNPMRVSIGTASKPAAKIKQEIIHTTASEKFGHLLKELNAREGAIIVFVKTKRGTEQLADKLERQDQSVGAIHGDLRQRKREQVIQAFRNQKNRIMIATDIAARGLDVPEVMHVINYDLPQCPEDYIHRIGRTGRAGKEGFSLCLISPEDGQKWKAIHRLMNPGEALEDTGRFSGASRGEHPGRKRRFGNGEGKGHRFGKPEGRSGENRFGKPEGRGGENRFGKPEGRSGENRFGKPEGRSGENRFGKPEGRGGENRFGKPEGRGGENRFGKPEGRGGENRFGKPEGRGDRFSKKPDFKTGEKSSFFKQKSAQPKAAHSSRAK